MKKTFFLLIIIPQLLIGQSKITGKIKSSISNEPIIGAVVLLQNTTKACVSDTLGGFVLPNMKAGIYNLVVSCIGYKSKTVFDVRVTNNINTYLDIEIEETSLELNAVVVKPSDFHKTVESPVSLKTLSSSEIERMPGGFRDISRVIQAFPGVAAPPAAWRNDIVIRGGASYENKFFLDGIQIPNINHFTTQGSAGGAYGLINPYYLKEADVYSGAFPSNKGNALSSVFDFKLKDGSPQKVKSNIVFGTTDFTFALDGKLNNKITYISSVRVANWNLISKRLGLFILPVYEDALIKIKYKAAKKEFTLLGVGANDYIEPNLKADKGPFVDQNNFAVVQTMKRYLRQLAYNKQWNYTIGGIYKQYYRSSNLIVSGSYYRLYNRLENYTDQANKTISSKYIDYKSNESLFNLRGEYNKIGKNISLNVGTSFDRQGIDIDNYTIGINNLKNKLDTVRYKSAIVFNQLSFFSQLNYSFKKASISLGIRGDMSDYSSNTLKILNQLSPRMSLSYNLTKNISLNFNTGVYHQLPILTAIAYRNNKNIFVNKDSLKYMRCVHIVGGIDYVNQSNLKISAEVFLKKYSHAPFLKTEQIPLATYSSIVSQQAVGNSPISSIASGNAYGFEFLLHQKLIRGFYSIVSYTFMKSTYSDTKSKVAIASTWDYRHMLSITAGKEFKNNLEIGLKFRLLTGGPYTPINKELSSLKSTFNINPIGYPDFKQINSKRFGSYNSMDFRIEKGFELKKGSISFYLDVQNIYNSNVLVPPFLGAYLDSNEQPITDTTDPLRFKTEELFFKAPFSILPTVGININL